LWVKKVGSFPTDEIMGAQNFHYGLKVFRNWEFVAQILHFWTKIFAQEENLPTAQDLSGNCPHDPVP